MAGLRTGAIAGATSALHASLILGVVWALWHLPLYFINGTYQAENGLGSLAS